MLEIQQVANEIKEKLRYKNEDDLIIQSFILGILQGKDTQSSQKDFFQSNLEILMSLNMLIDIKVYKHQRVQQLYNEALRGHSDLKQLCIQLEKEVFEGEYSQQDTNLTSMTTSNNQEQISQIFTQKKNQKLQNQSNWEIQSQPSILFPLKQQQQQDFNQFKNASMIYQSLTKDKFDESKSFELALQLQKQFEEEQQLEQLKLQQDYQEYQQFEDDKKNQIECKICLENIAFAEMATLYCTHIFHQKCLNQYCKTQISSRQFPILCPSGCKNNIIYSDLIEVLDDQQLIEFQQLTFKAYIESHGDEYSWCPTPDCKFVFVAGGNPQLDCPVCKKSYCLDCKIEYHNGFSCHEFKEKKKMESRLKNEKFLDDKFFSFIKGAKYKQCPKCKFWVEKSEGCNHMTCRCKFEFCYVCGGVYQKCACVKQAHDNWPTPLNRNRNQRRI
ncbi:unnamed protein product [Paramecium primaurelia]|uniref:RBR-type E3 ubiquitin transferase n=1 Tax=Paramecium primaurelia TaxID=5886 RepID=A0A8S1NK50_PARPR|nr:unnamed protein product [Paramecium primaurelia]